MKLKFKIQPYQTAAVKSVVDCFAGQISNKGTTYRIDRGLQMQISSSETVFRNADIQLNNIQVLKNIHDVQKRQNLPLSEDLIQSAGCKYNLDVEMETGTGKTYCYIKTIFEMYEHFGWSKFIIMVPSIAIREGVYKSLQITSEHFMESYGKKARFFIYNSKRLHELESFSSNSGINIMVINIQAFNATGKYNRRIYEKLDDFQSRRPIDMISDNRPILILDEPQKMGGKATMKALPKFKPIIILRYSATHKVNHNKVHRLDAIDAYNKRLVKKIAVRGIIARGLVGTNAYLYLESIELSQQAPIARIELEVKLKSGIISRQLRRLKLGCHLYEESGKLNQYRGFKISQIDYNLDTVEFTNGHVLASGVATGDIVECDIRRIQIRETIKAHLDKEKQLFTQGIKVLSLFFIDEVVKYRDYEQEDEKGEYARIFEDEYECLKGEYLSELANGYEVYRDFLKRDSAKDVHEGYFSIDRKNRMVEPTVKERGEEAGLSDDVNAYDLILKNKERLLSQTEQVRFIFSHSALREGWDNPNVFVICMLKHSDNTISRRQEVGRGLRLSVDQHGERIDDPKIVHSINVLTVVANESYQQFVSNLQKEIIDTLSERPRKADVAYFTGKVFSTAQGLVEITPVMAKHIYRYLLKHDYTDVSDNITDIYHQAKETDTLAVLPNELILYAEQVYGLIDSVFSDAFLPKITDDRTLKTISLNANFDKKAFQELWSRINHKVVYRVDFESAELVEKSIFALNENFCVTPLQFTVQAGIQGNVLSSKQLQSGEAFTYKSSLTLPGSFVHSTVKYDLVKEIAEATNLTRKTIADILCSLKISVFKEFKQNPENFIAEASRIINEQKATMIIERLAYDSTGECYEVDIFTANQSKLEFTTTPTKLRNHIYDYVMTGSDTERQFVQEIDNSAEVVVYAKLPRGFQIPTPVGSYNPDWAIAFNEGNVKHIYFVAETKGSMSSMQLREIERIKIDCARKFFDELNRKIKTKSVKYDVVKDYAKLMSIVM